MNTPLDREEVYAALFKLVLPLLCPKGQTPDKNRPFRTVSREVVEVQKVPEGEQPVLFMDEAFEENVYGGGLLKSRTWTVYFHVGCLTKKGTAATTMLNPLLDTVERAMKSTVPQEEQQLGFGDRITGVRLKGTAMKDHGNNSTAADARQAVCYVPVEIVMSA